MATPRYKLVDREQAAHYHIVSRCVQQAYLFGTDPISGQNVDHRKQWVIDRMRELASCYAIDVDAYAVMSNHFHMVVMCDPKLSQTWSDEEVARRWFACHPPMRRGRLDERLLRIERELLLSDPDLLAARREQLGDLSDFMKHLKQPIARRANLEMGRKGHFFEGRFYSGILLDEDAVLASMGYVDLNPVRAKIARSIEQCAHTSIAERMSHLINTPESLQEAVRPIVNGASPSNASPRPVRTRPRITLQRYIARLRDVVEFETGNRDTSTDLPPSDVSRWLSHVASIHRRQRAYGNEEVLKSWVAKRGFKTLGEPLVPRAP